MPVTGFECFHVVELFNGVPVCRRFDHESFVDGLSTSVSKNIVGVWSLRALLLLLLATAGLTVS